MICVLRNDEENNNRPTVKDGYCVIHTKGGVSYEVQVPFEDGHCANILYVHHHINERGQALYGFEAEVHKELFRKLITVDGVGPTAALKLMRSYDPTKILIDIADGDAEDLSKAKGIGKKTAHKIVDKLKAEYEQYKTKGEDLGILAQLSGVSDLNKQTIDLMSAIRPVHDLAEKGLIKLGFKPKKVEVVLRMVLSEMLEGGSESPSFDASVDGDQMVRNLITESLKYLG